MQRIPRTRGPYRAGAPSRPRRSRSVPSSLPARSPPVPRTLLWCAALALCALPAQAQQSVTSTEMVIRLNVQPMAAPKPALRYLLLPELKEQEPGNPIPNYLKCVMDQDFGTGREVFG